MDDQEIRALAVFFFYTLLDERRAIPAATEAVIRLREMRKKKSEILRDASLVAVTSEMLKQVSHKPLRPHLIFDRAWKFPTPFDLKHWVEFHRTANLEELSIIVWSGVLGLNETAIAKGLDLSTGTVRYRLGHAFRKLGAVVPPALRTV